MFCAKRNGQDRMSDNVLHMSRNTHTSSLEENDDFNYEYVREWKNHID